MTCIHYRHLLSRYLDGEVTPRQRRELLEHVEGCRDCATWLARARQTDVLLKGAVPEARPSDRVRTAILSSVSRRTTDDGRRTTDDRRQTADDRRRTKDDRRPNEIRNPKSEIRNPKSAFRRWTLLASGLLLRFDPSPKRVALVAATSIFALIGLAYSLHILPPVGGYKELGFLVPGEDVPVAVNVTPLAAISSGAYGVGGPVAVPNMVRLAPADNSRDVSLGAPMSVRFDQPMDRASVERSWEIDPPAAGTFTWSADNEVRFSAYEPGLLRGITYTVLLSSAARSMTGTPLRKPVVWSFRTKEPYGVVPGLTIGANVTPTDTFSLSFETPMNREQTSISLWADESGGDVPVTLLWEPEGRKVTVSPNVPMPEGAVYLRVGATSRTQTGDTLGQPHEFIYAVSLPAARLRLLDGRVHLVTAGVAGTLRYDLGDNSEPTPIGAGVKGHIPDEDANSGPLITFALYNLPAEYLSLLSPQKRSWPTSLTPGLPGGLAPVLTFSSNSTVASSDTKSSGNVDTASLPDTLPAGTYLLVASRFAGMETLSDWQMLVVADRNLALTGAEGGAPFWAMDAEGRPWQGGEISLYSSEGALLEKGLTDVRGLWTPDMPQKEARLAMSRDGAGHVAALLLDPQATADVEPTGSLAATLQTDRANYYPGQTASFRVLLHTTSGATPVPEQEVAVSLLTPAGNVLSSLTLKLDDGGGAGGLFNLPTDLRPGEYTLLVGSGGVERRFPLHVQQMAGDTLSVLIAPGPPEDETTRVVTRTVSVLATGGASASGAALTLTLGIMGDAWVSKPVTTTTNADGKATVALSLPAWISSYNDSGLYLSAIATLKDGFGRDSQYLDLTSLGATRAGMRQLVSPALNLAAVARPDGGGNTVVRVVTLDSREARGDVLLSARSPSGERRAWSLDLSGEGDLTVTLPRSYAGGRLTLLRAGVSGSREISLMPLPGRGMELQVSAPSTAAPNAPLALHLSLADKEGEVLAGTASVWFRRVAGDAQSNTGDFRGEGRGWEADVALLSTGAVSSTVQAPGTPGLWYMLSEASTGDGGYVQSWSVLRVLPGPSIQTPPTVQARAMEAQTLSIVVHNPGSEVLSLGIRLDGEGALRALGSESQALSIAAGGSQKVDWRVQMSRPGAHMAIFALTHGGESAGAWSLNIVASENARTSATFLSGVLLSERSVGVLVPSDIPSDGVSLQVQASTSMLSTLSSIASNLASDAPSTDGKAGGAAARLSAAAVIGAAYTQAGAQIPSDLSLATEERAHLLEQIYGTQHKDGSWGVENVPMDASQRSITGTSHVLLALRRYSLTSPEQPNKSEVQPTIDAAVVERGLAYLTSEVSRPLADHPTSAMLDERAYALYTLSSYGALQAEIVRPMVVYASQKGVGLSRAGQAWLAIALMQSGSTQDGLLLLDRLLKDGSKTSAEAAAPILEALLVADRSVARRVSVRENKQSSPYASAMPLHLHLLMESRQGSGWGTSGATADAVWALSLYAAQSGEKIARTLPSLTLNDRPIPVTPTGGDSSAVSLIIPGSEMHAGTNWLMLKALSPDQPLYYSLTLSATR